MTISTDGDGAITSEVGVSASDYGAGTVDGGHTVRVGEHVQREGRCCDGVSFEEPGVATVRKGVLNGPGPFFDGADASFSFRDMSIRWT